jgi:hypothetical protein
VYARKRLEVLYMRPLEISRLGFPLPAVRNVENAVHRSRPPAERDP